MLRSPILASLVLALAAALPAVATDSVLIRNVRIFDGVAAETRAGDVLVVDGRIDRIAPPGTIDAPAEGLVVDEGDRLLSPGFIDLHAHLTLQMPKDQIHLHPTVAGAPVGTESRPRRCISIGSQPAAQERDGGTTGR